MLIRKLAGVCLFALIGFSASSASAQVWSFGGTLGWPYGFYQDDYVPYYALHPPVYYSQPVPRTYGWSPFAYPPGVLTPEVACEPEILANPHVEGSSQQRRGVLKPKSDVDRSASFTAPKLIENPFVEQTQVAGE